MIIRKYKKTYMRIKNIENNNEVNNMENVLRIQDYMNDTDECENEWEIITKMFQSKIRKRGLTEKQVDDFTTRILKEVREEK